MNRSTSTPTTTAPSEGQALPTWPRTLRLDEQWILTEKVCGTHAVIVIKPAGVEAVPEPGVSLEAGPDGAPVTVRAASRTRWLLPEPEARASGMGRDNFAFATWVTAHAADLAMLGPGTHHGEWYGAGIGHSYGLTERRLALLDTNRWRPRLPDAVPDGLDLVPVLAECTGDRLNTTIARCLARLAKDGSQLVPGAAAEGVIAHSVADPRFLIEATTIRAGCPGS